MFSPRSLVLEHPASHFDWIPNIVVDPFWHILVDISEFLVDYAQMGGRRLDDQAARKLLDDKRGVKPCCSVQIPSMPLRFFCPIRFRVEELGQLVLERLDHREMYVLRELVRIVLGDCLLRGHVEFSDELTLTKGLMI